MEVEERCLKTHVWEVWEVWEVMSEWVSECQGKRKDGAPTLHTDKLPPPLNRLGSPCLGDGRRQSGVEAAVIKREDGSRDVKPRHAQLGPTAVRVDLTRV